MRACERVAHHEAPGPAELLVPDVVRSADGGAGVARRGLHVEFVERRLWEDAPVRDRVERHPAREAEIPKAGAGLKSLDDMEVSFLEAPLHRGRDVLVVLRELGRCLARGAEKIGAIRGAPLSQTMSTPSLLSWDAPADPLLDAAARRSPSARATRPRRRQRPSETPEPSTLNA